MDGFDVLRIGGDSAPPTAEAWVTAIRMGDGVEVSIEGFRSPGIPEHTGDWRQMVDAVLIDTSYSGGVFRPHHRDVPERRGALVSGRYQLPPLGTPSSPSRWWTCSATKRWSRCSCHSLLGARRYALCLAPAHISFQRDASSFFRGQRAGAVRQPASGATPRPPPWSQSRSPPLGARSQCERAPPSGTPSSSFRLPAGACRDEFAGTCSRPKSRSRSASWSRVRRSR